MTLKEIVEKYLALFPVEQPEFVVLLKQLADGEKLNERRNFTGHVTGSTIILSPDKTKVLLIDHKLFKRWQQPGGHWENDEEANPLDAARREAEEETAIHIAEYLPLKPGEPLIPLNIDSHPVPARPSKDERPHRHHDMQYAFIAASEELHHREQEVNAAAWFALDAPETAVIARSLAKLRQLLS